MNEMSRLNIDISNRVYLAVAFPVDEKPILVNFEHAVRLILGRLFVLKPSVEYLAFSQQLRHFYAPVKFELFCHVTGTLNETGITRTRELEPARRSNERNRDGTCALATYNAISYI